MHVNNVLKVSVLSALCVALNSSYMESQCQAFISLKDTQQGKNPQGHLLLF